ncbi:c-type cytochrome domain-containing protein, partial [Arsenicibacter rosenii]|uniref:c-type cytochrome domain-containing protein n=1 Tax=Arsenicibacter rosenii TaxID=1750698 RepID=UPI000A76CD97
DASLVQVHQWTGLATAGLSLLTYALPRQRWIPASLTIVFLTIAGHYGGSLTHGEGFLSFSKHPTTSGDPLDIPGTMDKPVAMTVDSAGKAGQPLVRRTFFYRDQVIPILEKNCYSCHAAKKKKGGLRLDSESFIRQGGKNGPVLLAGNPQKS